jgi:acetyl-CoA carboxylase biotin carboxyl carrier protein
MAGIDAEVVKHALKVAREHGYAELELANGEAWFRATLEPGPKKPKPVPITSIDGEPAEQPLLAIKANHVGYFRNGEGKLEVGEVVAKGDVVASIAALGLANDVESTVAGTIVEILVKDGDAVQFGQVLAQVKP